MFLNILSRCFSKTIVLPFYHFASPCFGALITRNNPAAVIDVPWCYLYTLCMQITDITIVYQDHYLLAINKPASIVIHPTYKHSGDTLWDALLAFWQQQPQDTWQPPVLQDDPTWYAAPPEVQTMLRQQRIERQWQEEGSLPRPCLLHRLDKDTSGIVALACTERSRRHFVRQFEDHTIQKYYLAVVKRGAPSWTRPRTLLSFTQTGVDAHAIPTDPEILFSANPSHEFMLAGPLGRDPEDRRRCIVLASGQHAATSLRVLGTEGEYALLLIQPITGRTHQIRAHLAALGCAIVGDPIYAHPSAREALSRQFLHASNLIMRSYPANVPQFLIANLPEELVAWLTQFAPPLLGRVREYFSSLKKD